MSNVNTTTETNSKVYTKSSRNSLTKKLLTTKNFEPLVYLYYKFYKPTSFPSIEHFIEEYAKETKEVFFMQIGANDGWSGDPLYRHIRLKKWSGILVEPLPDVFAELKACHPNQDRLHFENVALSTEDQVLPFYYVDSESGKYPDWVTKLSSFDKKVPERVLEKFPEAKVVSKDIDCTTVHGLLAKHKVNKVNLILIDTEGFDYEILKTIDLKKVNPDVILFEHEHLSESDYNKAIAQIRAENFFIYKAGKDTIGFRSENLKKKYKDYLI